MSDDTKHLNSFLHQILELLKKEDRYYTFQEIYESVGIHIPSNSQLLRTLKNNSKVEIDGSKIRFVPTYNIRSAEDVRAILKAVEGKEGVEMAKMLDSPVDVRLFIKQLCEEDCAIILKDMDGSEVLFHNAMPWKSQLNEDIKKLWASIKIPSYYDIVEELNAAGLKSTHGQITKRRILKKKEPKKRSQRRIKVTNTHVKDLDLSKMDESL